MPSRSRVPLLAILALLLAALPVGGGLTAPASARQDMDPTTAAALKRAVAGLVAAQNADGSFAGAAGAPDPSVTADAVVALASATARRVRSRDAIPRAVTYLESQATPLAALGPGPAAKLTLAAVAAGRDPRSFGGVDLVAALTAPLPAGTSVAPPGAFGDDLSDHTLVLLALAAAGEPAPPEAVALLRQAQNPEGGWAVDGSTASGAADSNTTALAIQALVAATDPTRPDPADAEAIRRGLDALHSFQAPDGGFVFQPAEPLTTDATSTALAVQAIIAVGQNPASAEWGNAAAALLAFQNPSGAFHSTAADPADNLFATLEAIPALAGLPLPVIRLCPEVETVATPVFAVPPCIALPPAA